MSQLRALPQAAPRTPTRSALLLSSQELCPADARPALRTRPRPPAGMAPHTRPATEATPAHLGGAALSLTAPTASRLSRALGQ